MLMAAGSFTTAWGALGPHVLHMILEGNDIQGQLPASTASWANVTVIYQGKTNLRFSIPAECGMDGAFPKLQNISFEINPAINGMADLCITRKVLPGCSGHATSHMAAHTLPAAEQEPCIQLANP